MTSRTDISKNVMRRVYFVHAVRPFVSNSAGAVVLLGISLYLLGREVFVAQIFRNIPRTDFITAVRYMEAAFFNTDFVVQALTVLAGIAGLWLMRECVRLLTLSQRFA